MGAPTSIRIGLEVLLERMPELLRKVRFGLLANQASVDRHLRSAKDLLYREYPKTFRCLFSPQHGFRSEKQDNMIESPYYEDPATGLPVIPLYGKTPPGPEVFEGIDLLVVDLQDVGTRVYTYAATMVLCMEACAGNTKMVVLDRPNPIGGRWIQGNLLEPEYRSLVGMAPLPMRHGLTLGEYALWMNHRAGMNVELEVIPMEGWKRDLLWPETQRVFVPPSPNMPCFETALVYPGQVIWEGTNVSEGRGTTRPFEMFGAPFFRLEAVRRRFEERSLPGVVLREIAFEPMFHKWAGRLCYGFHLHVVDPSLADPYYTSLCLLQDVLELHPDHFRWKEPPYEYETERLPIDLILGSRSLRERLEQGADLAEEKASWAAGLKRFQEERAPFLLYP